MYGIFLLPLDANVKKTKEINMIDKIKEAAKHYWTDHKEVVIIVGVVLAICIIH
jgi:hypothetical protein